MDLTERTKEALELRLRKLEDLISKKGLGSKYLNKAKKTQRNLNLAIVVGSAITIAGVLAWSLRGGDDS